MKLALPIAPRRLLPGLLCLFLAGPVCSASHPTPATGIRAVDLITGRVNDTQRNTPLAGATVVLKGSTIGTTTDAEGQFKLNVETLPATLIVSHIGFLPQTVVVASASQPVTVKMQEETKGLDEIVVSASRKPEKLTEAPAAISVLNARQLQTEP